MAEDLKIVLQEEGYQRRWFIRREEWNADDLRDIYLMVLPMEKEKNSPHRAFEEDSQPVLEC